MKQRHQPLRLKRVYECTCGVFCGTSIESWLRHAEDQKVLNPGIAEFNAKVLTPELYALQRAVRQVGKSFGHIREVYGRAFEKIAEPFRHLSETASCRIGECTELGTVQVVTGHYPGELVTLYLCEEHAAPFRVDGGAYSIVPGDPA